MLGIFCADAYACLPYEREKVIAAEQRGIEVMNSQCFADFMQKRRLVQTNGKTPAQVVSDLRENNLEAPVHYYYEESNVVGYRNPPKPDIYFNRYFHNNYGVCATASNAAHEWSHSIGYDHDYEPTARRPYSVPYSINAAFTACCPNGRFFNLFNSERIQLLELESQDD